MSCDISVLIALIFIFFLSLPAFGEDLWLDSPHSFPAKQICEHEDIMYLLDEQSDRPARALLRRVLLTTPGKTLPILEVQGAGFQGYLANVPSWQMAHQSFMYLAMVSGRPVHQLVRGASVGRIPVDQIEETLKLSPHHNRPERDVWSISDECVVASGGPLELILGKIIIGFREARNIWFHMIFRHGETYAELYLIDGDTLSVWQLPKPEYESGHQLVPELQAIRDNHADFALLPPEKRRSPENYPQGYATFWRKSAEYPTPFAGSFHALAIGDAVYLLNASGEVYEVGPKELLLVGQFRDWISLDQKNTRNVILLENFDNNTASVLEVKENSIRYLPFDAVSPEYSNPFQEPEFNDRQQEALFTLVEKISSNTGSESTKTGNEKDQKQKVQESRPSGTDTN